MLKKGSIHFGSQPYVEQKAKKPTVMFNSISKSVIAWKNFYTSKFKQNEPNNCKFYTDLPVRERVQID
jgi:hypothetical protein